MLLSAVSVLVVAQSSSEFPDGLMNNPVLLYSFDSLSWYYVKTFSPHQAVSRRPVTGQARVRFKANPRGIASGQSDSGTSFSPRTSLLLCQNLSTNAPYTFIHLLPVLYRVVQKPLDARSDMLGVESLVASRQSVWYQQYTKPSSTIYSPFPHTICIRHYFLFWNDFHGLYPHNLVF